MPEDTESLHGGIVGMHQVAAPALEATLSLRSMVPAPLPEVRSDIRHIGAPGDIFDGPVVDGQHGGPGNRVAFGIAHANTHV